MSEASERPIVERVDDRIQARWPTDPTGRGIAVDFGSIAFPGGPESLRGLPLVRACGRALAAENALLVDATAGLGYDAFLLAVAGFRVRAVERSPDVASLFEDGLRRAMEDPRLRDLLGGRLSLERGDARVILADTRPEVVYLDPMYPPKRRTSALPSKEMQLVRALVGDDLDAAELFTAARNAAPRVVVKRPAHAPALAEPTSSIEGKLARFDVFVRP